jgi:hypothetical protein
VQAETTNEDCLGLVVGAARTYHAIDTQDVQDAGMNAADWNRFFSSREAISLKVGALVQTIF